MPSSASSAPKSSPASAIDAADTLPLRHFLGVELPCDVGFFSAPPAPFAEDTPAEPMTGGALLVEFFLDTVLDARVGVDTEALEGSAEARRLSMPLIRVRRLTQAILVPGGL